VNGSIKIGTAFGIPIRLHWTFLVLLYAVAVLTPLPTLVALSALVALFGCVLLHELGHSLVARRFGIHVIDITFWPLGGMARMREIPEIPKVEGLVAIAGPAVNFVLAAIGVAVLIAAIFLGIEPLAGPAEVFIGVNLIMGTFNLVPAFPMDGGRILRAWCGRSTDWVTATEQAVAVGRICAVLMFFGSLLLMFKYDSLCALPLVAVFVWVAGGRELLAVRMRHGQSPFGGIRVANVFEQTPFEVQADAPAPPSPPRPTQAGFTDEAIRDLERFRGRLQRPGHEED
jgi:Zn-dependent protease